MNRLLRIAIIVVTGSLLAAAQTAPAPPGAPASPAAPAAPRAPRPPRAPRASHGQSYLGVDIRDLTPSQASALKLKNGHGVEVTMVD